MRGKTKKLAMSRSNVNSREKENESGRILSGRGSRGRERGRGRQGKGVGGRRKSLPCLPSLHTSVKQNTTGTIDKINHLNRIATTTRGGLSIASDGNPPSSLLRSSRAVTCRSKPSAPPLPRSSSRLSDTADSGRPRSNSFTEESGKTTLHQSDQNIESSHENGESGASDVKESSCTDASGSEALEQQTALIHEQVAVMVSENAASAAHRIFAFEQEFHERQQHLGLQLQALERKHTAKLRKKKERQLARQENAGTRGSRGPGSAGPDAEEEESESCAAASSADTDDLHNSISTSASSTDARRFQKICSEYARRGKSLGMLMDRLKLEFPHKSSKELEMRYDIHRDRRFLLDMKQLMHRQTSQEERLIRMQGQGLIDQLIEQQLRARAKECQYAKDDRKRLDAHEQLRKWRSKCKKQQAAQRALEKEREAKDKEHRRRLNKQESIWRKRDKHKLAAYNGERERQEMQRKREERETEEEEEALRQEQLKKGKVRVDFRKDLYSIKQMQILQKDLQLQQSEEERKQRLDSLRGSVRATIQNHFVSNPDRVWQHTRSSAQGRRHVNHALGAGGSGVREGDGGEGQGCSAAVLGGEVRRKMFDVHGYTNDQLNKDVRFRLVQKLERAGLHNTDYGRKVLCKAFTNHTAVGNPAANSRNKHTDF